jgi:hypothetical protein
MSSYNLNHLDKRVSITKSATVQIVLEMILSGLLIEL